MLLEIEVQTDSRASTLWFSSV